MSAGADARRALAAQVAGAVVTAAVSFSLMAYLGRALGAAQFGNYVAVLSLAVVMLVLIEGGWPTRVYRDGAGRHDDGAGLMGRAAAHIITVGTGLALTLALCGQATTAVALACMTLVAVMNLVSGRLRAEGRFGREAGWQVAGRVASAAAIVAAVETGHAEPSAVFLAWAAGLGLVLLQAGREHLARPRWAGLASALPLTLPFLLVEVLLALLMKADVALLRIGGAQDAYLSYYAACTRLNELALLAIAPVGNVMLRSLRIARESPPAFDGLWQRASGLAAAGGLAVLIAAYWQGETLVVLVFGRAFEGAGALLPFTAAMLPFALPNAIMAIALLARGEERWLVACLLLAGATFAVALPFAWQRQGAAAAAVAAAAVHAAFATACLMRLRRRFAAGNA